MKCAVYLCILATLTLAIPSAVVCDRADDQELILRRNRRTVQFLVNHFINFFGLSGGGASDTKKIEPKQDNVFALPFTNILKASAGKFSGVSSPKQNEPSSHSNREPTLQHDLPQWIDRPHKQSNPYSEAFETDSLEPTRVSLLSTSSEPEDTTTTSTTTEAPVTTTTPEPAPPTEPAEPEAAENPTATPEPEEPATNAPVTDDNGAAPQEGTSSTETPAAIAPEAVNRLSDTSLSSRNDAREESFQPTPVPLVSYQHYVQPSVWPAAGVGFQHTFPMQQYFGNNVFIPAQNSYQQLAAPFQLQTLSPPLTVHGQGYPSSQPVYDNRLYYPTTGAADSQATSHSRVKLHDNHYDLVTYHDDTEQAASTYQMQSFGNYRARRY